MIDIGRAQPIPGWMSDGELTWLAEQAAECELMIEIGTYLGRSARAVGEHCRGILYCIDAYSQRVDPYYKPELEEPNYQRAQWNLKDLIITGQLVLLRKSSVEGFVWLTRNVGLDVFDLAFIDADHRYEAVKQDIEMYSQLVKPGGWLVGHDYYENGGHPGVKQAVDEIFKGEFERPAGSIWRVRI